jgi:hypothetical protein
MKRSLVGLGFLLLSLGLGLRSQGQPPVGVSAQQHFDQVIAPLLARRCLDCHSGPKPRGGLDLTSHKATLAGDNVLVPGNARDSLLWKHVEAGMMPPKKPLPAGEKRLLKEWIDGGAAWGSDPIDPFKFTTDTRAGYDWWSLQPVVRPAPPKVQDRAWAKNPVDDFILARLEAQGLSPSPRAAPAVLLRRLYFDLIGMPPKPEEVQAFLEDTAPDAYEKVVDRLLASPHYGGRLARHWLDVVRFGESNGFEHDELRPNAWPFRDWVIQALNQDMPFDQFARLQLAGDVLIPDDPQGIVATGFLVAGGYDSVGQQQQSLAMKAVVRQDELEDIVGTVGQAFLGLTVNCARCHDHKFDPVRQKEYYQLTAALTGVHHGERNILSPAVLKALSQKQKAWQVERDSLLLELKKLEEPIRLQILAERKKSPQPVASLPEPLARWDFSKGLKDTVGTLHASLQGDAQLGPDGLLLSGNTGYATTLALKQAVQARTLTARVKLVNFTQKGGAVISLQTLDGAVFDAIVFGEKQAGHWMAGSDGFQRTQSFQAYPETQADKEFVHLALVYAADGTIAAYRNGRPYGKPYKSKGPIQFAADKAQLVFGLRHSPAQPGRLLAGTIRQAELFDRALTPDEVAALAGANGEYVSEQEIVARLDPPGKEQRASLEGKLQHLDQLLETSPPKQLTYAVVPKEPAPVHLLLRGNPAQKGEPVAPGGVAALLGLNPQFGLASTATDAQRRAKLAEWITHPKNPLFARVLANRLWQHHFGAGLVDTPNDFGFNGAQPSHPQLLDWLADELVRQKFSLKALHRLMVTSATYRQSSAYSARAAKVDAGNRLLWRKSPTRLEAEAVRDAILSVAGQLNPLGGGPGFQDFKVTIRGATYMYLPADPVGFAFQRRTIYRTWARSGRSRLLDTFDCPDPSTATHKRLVTTTPLQALALLNNSFVLRMADHFARRVEDEAGKDVGQQIARAYWLAYGRPPTAKETALVRAVVEAHGLAALCRAMFNSNEFVYVD